MTPKQKKKPSKETSILSTEAHTFTLLPQSRRTGVLILVSMSNLSQDTPLKTSDEGAPIASPMTNEKCNFLDGLAHIRWHMSLYWQPEKRPPAANPEVDKAT